MPTEIFRPPELLRATEVLDALGINCCSATEDVIPYLSIPGNSGPRWLIPTRSHASTPVLHTWRPYSTAGRVKWLGIRIATRTGLLQYSGSVSSVAVSRSASLRWFERCAVPSRNGEMVILVGNPSDSRKLIVFLVNDADQIAAVLKVGLSSAGGANILYEAEVLRRLKGSTWAPKILSIHPDLRAAAQEYVAGALATRHIQSEYLDLLCQLPRSGGSINLAKHAETTANAIAPFREKWDKLAPDLLDRALAILHLDIDLPAMLVHGDFAPWNLRVTPEARLILVDWESADFAGLPGHDLLHFLFGNDLLFGGKRTGSAALRANQLGAQYLRRMDLDAELWPRLAIAYLLHQIQVRCALGRSDYAAYSIPQLAFLVDALYAKEHHRTS